jgi:hypothetical protein
VLDEFDAELVANSPKRPAFAVTSRPGNPQHEFIGEVFDDHPGDFDDTAREVLYDAGIPHLPSQS